MELIPVIPEQQRHLSEFNTVYPHLDNISRILITPADLDFALLEQTLYHLFWSYDTFRLRFIYSPSGWRQYVTDYPEIPLHRTDLSGLTEIEQRKTVESEVITWQKSLNIFEGPLFRVVYFHFGAQQAGRILLTFHHLILDLYSLNIFLRDLMHVYQQIREGGKIRRLPTQLTSFKIWVEKMQALAQSSFLQEELEHFWLALPWDRVVALPIDCPGGGWQTNTRESGRDLCLSLSIQETQELLKLVNAETHILDILLTALTLTITRWTHSPVLYVGVINHGRAIFDHINATHTMGLIACLSHFVFTVEHGSPPRDALQAIKMQRKQTPQQGVGYGLLKYLSEDPHIAQKLLDLPRCEVILNYSGVRQERNLSIFHIADEDQGPTVNPHNLRPQILAVEVKIKERQLTIQCRYSMKIHYQSTIETFLQEYTNTLKEFISPF